ncbi:MULTISPECIES: thiamine diphosphokinase [Clostridium]|uniref:Thiamine diphosphokinase n=3 Tax=Clostridium butyricum TaxID=1492 RepID=C4IJG9_CLOBU|nr:MULTISPECIES: thiamine diphosphokinase [Clostridium]ETI91322.1 MAG: Thiamine pyrophosphokinase [Clostridium butyricum DORA_1]AXB84271.1 thiamine diphosphokinase [Clostridium butyricum]EDT73312.1 thiamine pyrophosphokinase [Clostridium butyricum 5521]EEP53081.1 thiamine diphosphokinase [Clostridium butyricum E4 str. BoNT E BL5262]EMU54174.1 thiamine diphosphokinase [Clostridium butyricum DKU-01]
MKAIIVTGGNKPSKKLLNSYIKSGDLIIGADKGSEYLYDYEIMPNIILGDFDSISEEKLKKIEEKQVEIIKFPPEKDYTDTEIAIMEAMKRGADTIYLFGGLGTRADHSLGNIGLLLTTKNKGARLLIVDDHNKMYLADKNMSLNGSQGEIISFHALSDVVKGFEIRGAKYNLNSYDMHLLDPRAVCNEFIDTPINIKYESGELLIIHAID